MSPFSSEVAQKNVRAVRGRFRRAHWSVRNAERWSMATRWSNWRRMPGHWKRMAISRKLAKNGWRAFRFCRRSQCRRSGYATMCVNWRAALLRKRSQPASSTTPQWAKKLGPLGPILLALLKFKSLLSFVAFFGFYWTLWGAKFGIGFAVLILIHEMGHFIDIKRRGLPADMPMFLPGIWGLCEVERAGRLAGNPLCRQSGRAMCRRDCSWNLLFVVAPDWLWIVGRAGANRRMVQRTEFDPAVDL